MYDSETILKTRCSCCNQTLNEFEHEDPIVIDGETFKDSCASNLIQLRLQGYVKHVATRTNKLVKTHNKEVYNKVYDRIYDDFGNHNITL